MKKYTIPIFLAFIINPTFLSAQEIEIDNFRPAQIWNLMINHYDPQGIWERVGGSLHTISIRPNGELTSEDIIINNQFDIYQSFLFRGDSILMRKKAQKRTTFSVNGNTKINSTNRFHLKLTVRDINFIRRRHLFEIGLPMYLKAAEIQFEETIKEGKFNGRNCLILESKGTSLAKKQAYPFIQQPIFYYVNSADFSLLGMDFPTVIEEQNIPGYRITFAGEIDMNGIKMPQVKNYFHYQTGKYLYTTTFHPFTRKEHIDKKREQQIITELLRKERVAFRMRNFEVWADCWSHRGDVFQSYVSNETYDINEGWEQVKQFAKDFFITNLDPHVPNVESENFTYSIYDNIAWVYFDIPEGSEKQGRHQRILRKENGKWKIINWTGFDSYSYQSN